MSFFRRLSSIVFVLLGAGFAWGCGAQLRSLENDSQLRVVSYRLRGNGGAEVVRRIAREWNPDVFLLQSTDRGSGRALGADVPGDLADELRMDLAWLPLNPESGGEEGLAILSRVRIRETFEHKLDRIAPEQFQQGALGVEVSWGDTPLVIWNVRLGSEEETGGELYAQTRHLTRLLGEDAPRGSQARQLIGGSFGMTPNAVPLGLLKENFADVWAARGSGLGYTSPSTVPRRRVDYFWTPKNAPGYAVSNILVIHAPGASDHLPLVVDLTPIPGAELPAPPPDPLPEPLDDPLPAGEFLTEDNAESDPPSEGALPDTRRSGGRRGGIPGVTRPFGP
jgi:endonuclease/exonuclease/phosphatase family metal-dependent hydrolase